MRMVVTVMVMTMIVMMMAVRLRGFFRVGPAFRIERRFDARNFRAEFHHQFFQHMIAADADAVAQNLRGYMAVAEMPCDAREMMRVACSDFRNRFAGGNDANHAAVFELQAVAIPQHHGFREIEQEHGVARAAHRDAAAMPAIMWQLDTVGLGCLIPLAGGEHFGGADHELISLI